MKLLNVILELLCKMPVEEPEEETEKDVRGRVFLIGGSAINHAAGPALDRGAR